MDRIIALLLQCLFMATANAESSIGQPLQITPAEVDQHEKNNIRLLGALNINSLSASGKKLMEFSGLAWDNDEQILYALSDRGYVTHLHPVFRDGQLSDVQLLGLYPLNDENKKPLTYKMADSEGLTLLNSDNGVRGDTQLVVSFERRPRLARYEVNGRFIAFIPIPDMLKDINNYDGENKSLEAVTYHPQYQFLLGVEKPVPDTGHNLFVAGDKENKSWTFTPSNLEHGSLVDLAALPNGLLIILERSFPGIFAGVTSTLHLAKADEKELKQTKLVSFRPGDGLFNDNFEGIAWHRDRRFFMISDDNDSLLQRTALLYFAILNLDDKALEIQSNKP